MLDAEDVTDYSDQKWQGTPDGVPADAVDISGDGGCCKKILVKGDPAEGVPFAGAEVQVHYVGTLMDGSKFDSSRDRPGNFRFKLGKGQVIKGWDTGVATMHKGEKAELFCRSDYAYGEHGHPPTIPGGATLKFEVELLSWAEPAKQRHELSASEKLAEATAKKTKGTEAFKAGEWVSAHMLYIEAATWVDQADDFVADEHKTDAAALLVSCMLNAAQCSLKTADWPMCVKSCDKVLKILPLADVSKAKALFRRGSARIRMCDFDEARADLKEAASLDPKSKEVREAYASIKDAEKASKAADKALYANMVKGAGSKADAAPAAHAHAHDHAVAAAGGCETGCCGGGRDYSDDPLPSRLQAAMDKKEHGDCCGHDHGHDEHAHELDHAVTHEHGH